MDSLTRQEQTRADRRVETRPSPIVAHRFPAVFVFLFLALFLASGILTLPQYGIGWDEGLGSFFFGERYLFYLGAGQEKYLDFDADLARLQQLPLDTFESPFRAYPYEYPALVNTPSAGLMHLLGYRLGWMDPVDAFHLLTVVLATLLLGAVVGVGAARYGRATGFFAMLFLGLFPRLWGDMHFNSKDVPEMIFFGLALLALLAWQARPTWRRVIAAGLALGAALSIKANGYFILLIYLLAIFPWSLRREAWAAALRGLWRSAAQLMLIGLMAAEVFVFSWPYLYQNFLTHLRSYLAFVLSQGGRQVDTPASLTPLWTAVSILPEWMLLFVAIGLIFLVIDIVRSNRFEHRLLFFWLLVPVARACLPDMVNFDGIRHFMEFVPAAALVAGLGVERLARRAGQWRPSFRSAVFAAALLGVVANTAWIETRYRGFEHLYYNTLPGGFSGARASFGENEASDYWAVTYRAGLAWINAHAESGAAVHVPLAGWLVTLPRRAWLRDDLQLLAPEQVSPPGEPLPARADRPTYVMFIRRPGYYNELADRLARASTPVYQINLEQAPLLFVYRLSPGDRLAVEP